MKTGSNNTTTKSHWVLLSWWIVYFTLYYATERLIPYQRCSVIHCPLDDRIPFCELFVIPYMAWYGMIVFCLIYFGVRDVNSFRKFMFYIIGVQLVATLVYIVFPSRQELRPESVSANFLGACIRLLYAVDTPSNIFPSLHVAISVGMASVWIRRKGSRCLTKIFMSVFALLVCASTVLIKQHSLLDGIAALLPCLIMEKLLWQKEKEGKTAFSADL